MRKYLKVIYTVVTILMFVSFLTACGQAEINPPIDKESPDLDKNAENNGNPFFEDEEGHVRVALEDGKASITFNVERWNETYGFQNDGYYFIPDDLQDVFFPIIARSGNVIDACVARVMSLGSYFTDDFELPVVVLLMDDGSIEWFYADPNSTHYFLELNPGDMYSIDTYEKIERKYSGDFVSINCVSNDEDSNYKTIYAVSSYGYSFDFYEMYLENQLFDNVWICELQEDSLYGYLSVDENYNASFSISGVKFTDLSSSDLHLIWSGMARYVTSPDDDLPLGTITFDMESATESSVDGLMLPQDMVGDYLADITFDKDHQMTLYHKAGDKLYPSSENTLVFTSWYYASREGTEYEARRFFAYIRVSELAKSGMPQFEFDEVERIQDENEPNGYRIENKDVEWINYTVTEDVVFTVQNDGNWEPKFLDIYEFSDYVKDWPYDDNMIVIISIGGEKITAIEEAHWVY